MRLLVLLSCLAFCYAWRVSIESTGVEGVVRASVANPFDKPVTVCVWESPLDANNDVFRADMFAITPPEGEFPQYVGIVAKRLPTISDFVTLQPGQTIETTLNLFKGYWFPVAGEYKLSLRTAVRLQFGEVEIETLLNQGLDTFEIEPMTSNTVTIQIATLVPAPYWGEPLNETNLGNPAPRANCNSGTWVSQINTAGSNAISATTQGINYLSPSSCSSSLSYYITWFGACDANRYSTVKNCYSRVRTNLQASYPVDCAGSSCTSNTYAYVYPADSTHTVYVCGVFWRVPSSNCVMDSQPGTLIHEMSHFNNVCSTSDVTYGQTACKNLASSNPANAVRNADNYCFFTDACPR